MKKVFKAIIFTKYSYLCERLVMYCRIMFSILIVYGLTVNAQTINLHGKVTDRAGTAIPNAIVALKYQGIMDTTGTEGTFSISGITAIKLPSLPLEKRAISFKNGVLEFHLTHTSAVKVEIFNAKGSLLKKVILQDATAGVYRLKIMEHYNAANLLIIHASIGSREMSFTSLPFITSKNKVNSPDENSISVGSKLAKIAVVTDTLKISAPGYKSKTVVIFSYDTVVNITLDTNSKIMGNWRLERATCTIEGRDSCRVGLQICPSFYCFSDNRLTKYESSYEVRCTAAGGCDTTIKCYDTLHYEFQTVNDTTYQCWGDSINITFKSDTLVFKRLSRDLSPGGTNTYYFVKETQPVPYCSRGCTKNR
jgi:hypothetical protein